MHKCLSILSFILNFSFSYSHETNELKESTALIKPINDGGDFYTSKSGFKPVNFHESQPIELEEQWTEIESPYPEIDKLSPDIWQALMVRCDLRDILSLASTCKLAFKGYIKLPLYKIIYEKLSILQEFQLLSLEYQPLKTVEGKNNFQFPETTQGFAHRMALLCQQESLLKNQIKTFTIDLKSGQEIGSRNAQDFLETLDNQWIPDSFIQGVLEDAMKNYPFMSTKTQDEDLKYMAQHIQYPHVIAKKRQILKSAILQLSSFILLGTPYAYGLYRYYDMLPPPSTILKGLEKLTRVSPYSVGDTFTRSYFRPRVQGNCVGNYNPSLFWTFNPDYELRWYKDNQFQCKASWGSGTQMGNRQECLGWLNQLHLNTTFWMPYLDREVSTSSVPCSLNLGNNSITCGRFGDYYGTNDLKFSFNTIDLACTDAYWQTSYTFLALAGFVGSAALFWQMLEGHYGHTYFTSCVAGLIYAASFIAVYSIPSVYH